MEEQKNKCSSNKHLSLDAIAYCPLCKLYLCNKCQNRHSEFYSNHLLINLNQNNIFIDECKQEKHENNKLKFFCKNHNTLCCAYCISKIKTEFFGQHSYCDVCDINDIKDEKLKKLKKNINILENLSDNIEKSLNDLKKLTEKINENKDKIKLKIQNIFTKLRKILNEKEDKLLSKIDEIYDNILIKHNIIKENEKLPNKIKLSLKKGKVIEKELNDDYNLSSLIYECLNIENNMDKINKINETINTLKSNDNMEIDCYIEEDKINNILKEIDDLSILSNSFINLKNPIHKLTNHNNDVTCLTILNDGRLVSCSFDSSIIIYNKITYKPDLIIKEHKHYVLFIIKLNSGLLASSSSDTTIKLFEIKGNEYEVLQIIGFHKSGVLKIIELKDKTLVSCSHDKSIIFFTEENLEYKKNFELLTNGNCTTVIQTKENEICYSQGNNNEIYFYDLLEKKMKFSIDNISKFKEYRENFIMISNYLLAIPGENQISLININEYKVVRIVEVPNSDWICGVCLFNNMLITGDDSKTIRQWKIENDNLTLISKKENAHDGAIITLLNMGNGHIASGSQDDSIKIW